MTYCLGIKVQKGLVAVADTRITSGTDVTTKKKIYTFQKDNCSLFIMTSGLRSVRDKAIVYFQEVLEEGIDDYNKMFKAVNAFGEQVKRVAEEDRESLEHAGFKFNLNTIIGGQLRDDEEHKLFLLYPEGNWVELGEGAPYVIIGNAAQGKAILNRVLKKNTSLKLALKAAFVSFDSTRISAADVDFPIDVALYKNNSFDLVEYHYEEEDLNQVSTQWDKALKSALKNISNHWMDSALIKLNKTAKKRKKA
ncbi:peptidase [Mucilaginibacter sp. HMF5004]|uniref:peptidase n=1 Tax=Mucilaginibacter rivuli TaxID=2857527 RepID=UPI001C5F033D|nr:peptidase [Mucilaginibacter rivuli]MBW4891582.1 peptidase [Mucilaginibacter rivuli]